jgi:3,4-dihydroxy 2-butanone 4-phosphate synthase / GTP cyclohydrolase II
MVNSIDRAIHSLSQGKIILLIDNLAQTQRGLLVVAAEHCSEENIAEMANHARGLIFAAMDENKLKELRLPMMVGRIGENAPEMTVSVGARFGTTTGISASDRAKTLRTLASTQNPSRDIVTPGHIFPLRTKTGGVLIKTSFAEAAVDLVDLSRLSPVAGICECLSLSGELENISQLKKLAAQKNWEVVSIEELVQYRLSNEEILEKLGESDLPVKNLGTFKAIAFQSKIDGAEHLVLTKGDLTKQESGVFVRVQAEKKLGELFGFNQGRRSSMLALKKISENGSGAFIYIRRGKQLPISSELETLTVPALQKLDTHNLSKAKAAASLKASELREFGIGAQIIKTLGIKNAILLGSSKNTPGIEAFGVKIIKNISL